MKRLKMLAAPLLLMGIMFVAFASFNDKSKAKNVDEVCFVLCDGVNPDILANLQNKCNWKVGTKNCVGPREIVCKICITNPAFITTNTCSGVCPSTGNQRPNIASGNALFNDIATAFNTLNTVTTPDYVITLEERP